MPPPDDFRLWLAFFDAFFVRPLERFLLSVVQLAREIIDGIRRWKGSRMSLGRMSLLILSLILSAIIVARVSLCGSTLILVGLLAGLWIAAIRSR